jgi:hypothetical protein
MKKWISIFVLGFCCGLTFAKDFNFSTINSSHIEPDYGFSQDQQKHWQMGVY